MRCLGLPRAASGTSLLLRWRGGTFLAYVLAYLNKLVISLVELGSQFPSRAMSWRLFLALLLGSLPTLRCEGGRVAWDLTEPTSMEIGNAPGERPYRKRTYKRACARALQLGGTWYRNQWITTPLRKHLPDLQSWQPRPPRIRSQGRRLRIFSWNALSLTQELWHEIQCYAVQQELDVLLLQSTCWTFESTWTSHGYHIVHNGTPDDPHGGVLTMISKRLCQAHDISYSGVLPGRLLHVRAKLTGNSIDILNVYQQPWRTTWMQDQNMEAREIVWHQLHESLTNLPFRNQLVLGGDFNASLITDTLPDHKTLQQLVNHHGLGSLLQHNSRQPTYFSPQGNTQIDYVFSRRCQLDAMSKQGIVDVHNCLASWRTALDHRPLQCSMPSHWKPWKRRPLQHLPQLKTRDQLIQHQQTDSPTWQVLCTNLEKELPLLRPEEAHLPLLHETFLSHIRTALIRPQPHSLGPAPGGLRKMWETHAAFVRAKPITLANLFSKWRHWSTIQRLRKHLRRFCKQSKRNKLECKIQEATSAFYRRDPYRMYKVVRDLAPKSPYRTVQLRSANGLAQDPGQELESIARFLAELCQGREWTYYPLPLSAMPSHVRNSKDPWHTHPAPRVWPLSTVLVSSLKQCPAP